LIPIPERFSCLYHGWENNILYYYSEDFKILQYTYYIIITSCFSNFNSVSAQTIRMTVWAANPVTSQHISRQDYQNQERRRIQYQRYYELQHLLRNPNSVISAVSPQTPGTQRLRHAMIPGRWHPSDPVGAQIPERH